MSTPLRVLAVKAFRFWRTHGTKALIHRLRNRLQGVPESSAVVIAAQLSSEDGTVNVSQLLYARFPQTTALRLFLVPDSPLKRITMVTDSLSSGHLYGGVGTAILMAAKLAEARGARLRIMTRSDPADPIGFEQIATAYGLNIKHEVEFVFAPFFDATSQADFFRDELFITTSWWTTSATVKSVAARNVVYLLQEDERMFYPFGDEHMRCSQVLANEDIRYVINTRLLREHLCSSGLDHLAQRSVSFEPAFPASVFRPRARPTSGKRQFLFYARPNNLRNLFYFGIELIEAAIRDGVLDLDQWDVVLVGKDIPRMSFANGYQPIVRENLYWQDYAELVGGIDLALCLMYTPHPSYPPFDLASSGAVVVTNRFGLKQELADYSGNILCADLDLDAMKQAMAAGARLALDAPTRTANHAANKLQGDWHDAFAEVLPFIGEPA